MKFYSPLRYPGGKGKIAAYVGLLFKTNLLMDGYYVEPYAGGASVALTLLLHEYASNIIINDIDRSIYAFWHSVLYETDALCQMISDTCINVDGWRKNRNIQQHKNQYSLLRLGFSTFYLSRVNRSGIIMGGIIGGVQQAGQWKIDARFNKRKLIDRIEKIAQYKNRITIYNLDARELVRIKAPTLPANTLFYFDPPYYEKGRNLYVNYYNAEDHHKMATAIKKIKRHKWIVTYDNTPEVRRLYNELRIIRYSLNYSATKPKIGKEIMIFSNNICIPTCKNPSKITSSQL